MKVLKSILIIILLFISDTASAGWYECYNFEGKINQSSITLSFQYLPGYFGGLETADLNLIGCYKYDRYNTPIKIRGIWEKENHLILIYELDGDDNITAFFRLEESAPGIWRGYWEDRGVGKKLQVENRVEIHLTSQLNDTKEAYAFSGVEMLQAACLPDYYFVGVYTKDSTPYRHAYMTALKIISKKDDTIFQTLNFDDYFYDIGNVRTIIYDNVELNTVGYTDGSFRIWCDAGKMGGYYDVFLSLTENKFEVAPEPFIDGVGEADPVSEED